MSSQRKKLKKLGFDIDGVLCDFNTEFWNRANARFGLDVDPNAVPSYWYMDEVLGGKEKAGEFFAEEIANDLFQTCLPYPEGQIFVTNLLEDKSLDIKFITARSADHNILWDGELVRKVRNDTKEWLSLYFPTFDQKNLIYAPQKDEVIYKEGIQLFVEDSLATADRLSGVCTSLLLNRSWNTGDTSAIRINSIAEASFWL